MLLIKRIIINKKNNLMIIKKLKKIKIKYFNKNLNIG